MRERRCLPRWGKGAAVWRAWFWRVYGEKHVVGQSAFQEGLAGAPGGRGRGSAVGKGWIYTSYAGHAVLWVKTRPFPTERSVSPTRSEDRLSAQPATAIFPRHPAGRTAGSARTRPRDQSLGYPFLRTGPHLLRQACRPMGENAPFPRFAARGEDRLAAPSRDRHIPLPSRGENGGLCPHPPKGPVPGYPFLGDGLHLPRLPIPQNAEIGRAHV